MKYQKLFNSIVDEGFAVDVAILATSMLAINIAYPLHDIDPVHGKFTKTLIAKYRDVFWEEPKEHVDEAIQIWQAIHLYNMCNEMDSLGGCKRKTFKELIEENNFIENI